ncbi:MAG: tRNA (guanosine(46)-N7)-methyltransferase TrmB [bacterium]|nr:tRNA (guanosine(46)-N7)-methyltransferase TrmB [bacterium]
MTHSLNPRREKIAAKDPRRNPYTQKILEYEDWIWLERPEHTPQLVEYLGRPGPLVLDLGCGSGNFLRESARISPEKRFIGFELRYKRLVLGARKFKKWGVENVRLAQARAEEIDQWFEEDQLDRVHVNFPDPWPKQRHRKNRLIQEPWLAKLKGRLKSSGEFMFKTDHQEYFTSVLELLKKTPHFEVVELSWDLHNSEYAEQNVLTEFEQLFRSKGMPVYHLKARPIR